MYHKDVQIFRDPHPPRHHHRPVQRAGAGHGLYIPPATPNVEHSSHVDLLRHPHPARRFNGTGGGTDGDGGGRRGNIAVAVHGKFHRRSTGGVGGGFDGVQRL